MTDELAKILPIIDSVSLPNGEAMPLCPYCKAITEIQIEWIKGYPKFTCLKCNSYFYKVGVRCVCTRYPTTIPQELCVVCPQFSKTKQCPAWKGVAIPPKQITSLETQLRQKRKEQKLQKMGARRLA